MIAPDLFRMFDRCVVINLARRADRLAKFQKQLDDSSWPFRPVEIVKAIDGNRVPTAPPWESGGGAWGCRQSHLRALEDALNDGVDSILVMEDDAYIHRPRSVR